MCCCFYTRRWPIIIKRICCATNKHHKKASRGSGTLNLAASLLESSQPLVKTIFLSDKNSSKMNSKLWIFVALFGLCGLASAHKYKSGECPAVEPMQGFDMRKVSCKKSVPTLLKKKPAIVGTVSTRQRNSQKRAAIWPPLNLCVDNE